MTHFDFKTLLPALLQVEDRMSMAHGLESRVPFLDHPLVEFAATMPADVKFKDGQMKHVLQDGVRATCCRRAIREPQGQDGLPGAAEGVARAAGAVRDFVDDVFSSRRGAAAASSIDNARCSSGSTEPQFGRKLWGLLSWSSGSRSSTTGARRVREPHAKQREGCA